MQATIALEQNLERRRRGDALPARSTTDPRQAQVWMDAEAAEHLA